MELLGHFRLAAIVLPAAVLCMAALSAPAQGASRDLLVEASGHARVCVPMSVELPAGVDKARMTAAGKAVPCQVAEGRLWWILDELAAGKTRTYSVELGVGPAGEAKDVELKQRADRIDVTIGGQPFTTYVFRPAKVGGHELRRPYFFPVYGPDQTTMTRPFPMEQDVPANVAKDHPHHTSIYVAHGAVNGVDNWSIGAKAGWQVHKGFDSVGGGAVVGGFRETLDWTSVDRKPVLAETRTVRVYRLDDSHRMLDLEIRFQAKYGKVVFGDTKEGGLCATRMRPEFRADKKGAKGRLINSEGLTAGASWGKKATWTDCSGLVGGKRYGFALFDAPGNLRHPTTWHARTYGLLTANPFGLRHFDPKAGKRGDYTLPEGKERLFRYRIYFHAGDEKRAKVAARWADFADPPKATWK